MGWAARERVGLHLVLESVDLRPLDMYMSTRYVHAHVHGYVHLALESVDLRPLERLPLGPREALHLELLRKGGLRRRLLPLLLLEVALHRMRDRRRRRTAERGGEGISEMDARSLWQSRPTVGRLRLGAAAPRGEVAIERVEELGERVALPECALLRPLLDQVQAARPQEPAMRLSHHAEPHVTAEIRIRLGHLLEVLIGRAQSKILPRLQRLTLDGRRPLALVVPCNACRALGIVDLQVVQVRDFHDLAARSLPWVRETLWLLEYPPCTRAVGH